MMHSYHVFYPSKRKIVKEYLFQCRIGFMVMVKWVLIIWRSFGRGFVSCSHTKTQKWFWEVTHGSAHLPERGRHDWLSATKPTVQVCQLFERRGGECKSKSLSEAMWFIMWEKLALLSALLLSEERPFSWQWAVHVNTEQWCNMGR